MKKLIIESKWEYEIIENFPVENTNESLKNYSWRVVIYKDGKKIHKQSAFGSIVNAENYVRRYMLAYEFGE
jgi:hypothetical protein